MDREEFIDLVPSIVVLFVLLVITVSILRLVFGEPMWFAELGVALLIALIYPRIVDRFGFTPEWWTE